MHSNFTDPMSLLKEEYLSIEMELKNAKHMTDEDDMNILHLGDDDIKHFGEEFGNVDLRHSNRDLDLNL